jgi:hypothetical protein
VKGLLGLLAVASVVAFANAGAAGASTTVAWKATFPEPFGGPNNSPFSCSGSSCGSGVVLPLGRAQDVIVFSGPGGVRTLTFADGSTIVMDEVFSNFQPPGGSGDAPGQAGSYGFPFTLDLSDTIVGGTGRFAGASGTASGQVRQAGGIATITLSGTVTF